MLMFYMLVTDKGFNDIFSQYKKYSYTVCKNTIERRVKKYDFPWDEIGDIVIISFTKLFLYMEKGEEVENIKSLIARITELSTVNYLDKYMRETGRIVTDYYDSDDVKGETLPDPIDIILDDENMKELITLIKTLDTRYSSVMLLYYVHEMSFKEIADIAQIPYSTICTWHTRGKRILAKKLQEKGCEVK